MHTFGLQVWTRIKENAQNRGRVPKTVSIPLFWTPSGSLADGSLNWNAVKLLGCKLGTGFEEGMCQGSP